MDENFLRFLMLAGFLTVVLGIAAISGDLTSYSLTEPFESYYPTMEFDSVSGLLSVMPLSEHVSVKGTVSEIGEDYVSPKGYEYQQFRISDDTNEVKVFCSKRDGSADVAIGDIVVVQGKFQKYYDSLEIYADCSFVKLAKAG